MKISTNTPMFGPVVLEIVCISFMERLKKIIVLNQSYSKYDLTNRYTTTVSL